MRRDEAQSMRVELSAEPSKNEFFVTTLRKLLAINELVIDTGNIMSPPCTHHFTVQQLICICTIKNTALKGS